MYIVETYDTAWRPIYGSVNPVKALKRYIREYEALREGGVRLKEVRDGREIGIRQAWAPRR